MRNNFKAILDADKNPDSRFSQEINKIYQEARAEKEALESLKQSVDKDLLTKLSTCYSPREMREIFRKSGNLHLNALAALPEKIYGQDENGKVRRMNSVDHVRALAREQLIAIQPPPAPLVGTQRLPIGEESKIPDTLARMKKVREPLDRGSFFSHESFEDKAQKFLNEDHLWFSPGFQASAARQAKEMKKTYLQFSAETEALASLLHKQHDEVQALLEHTAHSPENNKLQAELDDINKKLETTQKVLEKLHGTGKYDENESDDILLKRNGVLGLIEEAEKARISHAFEDKSLASQWSRDVLKPGEALPPLPSTTTMAQTTTNASTVGYAFKEICRIKPNEKAIYTCRANTAVKGVFEIGRFSEERSEVRNNSTDNVYRLMTFPKDDNARHQFITRMAIEVLEHLEYPPSAEHPIYISGADPDQLKYLTAAILAINEAMTGKLDPKAIRVQSLTPDFPSRGWEKHLGIGTSDRLLIGGRSVDKAGFFNTMKSDQTYVGRVLEHIQEAKIGGQKFTTQQAFKDTMKRFSQAASDARKADDKATQKAEAAKRDREQAADNAASPDGPSSPAPTK